MRIIMLPLFFLSVLTAPAKEVSFSLSSIDAILSKVAIHAQSYPPQFSSVGERKQIETDLRGALVLLDGALAYYPDNPDLLFRDGFANAMGHNLDFPGCAEKAFKSFDRLLELKPDDGPACYYYGTFLAETAARHKDSIPYLKKAISLGITDAEYPLAFVYLSENDLPNALLHLKAYAKTDPDNKTVRFFIGEIEASKLSVVRHKGSPPGLDEITKAPEASR